MFLALAMLMVDYSASNFQFEEQKNSSVMHKEVAVFALRREVEIQI